MVSLKEVVLSRCFVGEIVHTTHQVHGIDKQEAENWRWPERTHATDSDEIRACVRLLVSFLFLLRGTDLAIP